MFWLNCFRLESDYLSNIKKSTLYFGGHKIEEQFLRNFFTSAQGLQFTNQCVFSFRFTNLLVCFFFLFRSPSWLCGSSRRGGVTRKDAWWWNYFGFVHPLFPLYQIVSDYKDKFQIENFSEIYQYFQKWILERICSLPNRNTLQIRVQNFNKLPVSLNRI